jgi:sulfate adenylyltransferase subunit 1 (EFTu-like GTPase family)
VKASRNRSAGPIDFSLFTDGLKRRTRAGDHDRRRVSLLSRRRGRKFILADTPGHEQYTRNMATGASTADVAHSTGRRAHGVASRRAARAIAQLLGISRFVLAVNKMESCRFRP